MSTDRKRPMRALLALAVPLLVAVGGGVLAVPAANAEPVAQRTPALQQPVSPAAERDEAASQLLALDSCVVDGATLEWGFKESFRAYVSGTIARGAWTTADGATYATPSFGWAGGVGGVDAELASGEVAFTGSITFTGHGGVLNTTVSNPVIRFDGDTATMLLDVAGETRDGQSVQASAVEFGAFDLIAAQRADAGDAFVITAAPGQFTEAGSAAFGTYPEGEVLDPITITLPGLADCASAVDTATDETDTATSETETDAIAPIADAGADLGRLWWVLGGAGALVIAAVVVFVVRARARA